MDVYPCVIDKESWTPEISIEGLFSHLCAGTSFSHDQEMRLIYGVDTVPHLESSPHLSSCKRAHDGTPKSEPPKPRLNGGLLRDQSALGQSNSANTRASSEELGSATSNKRQGTTCISTSSLGRVNLEKSSRGRSEEQVEGVLARSLLGWLGPLGTESMSRELTMSDSTGKKSRNIMTKREWTASPRPTRADPDDGELNRSPFSWSDSFSGQSNLSDKGQHVSMRNRHTPSLHSSHGRRNSSKRNAYVLGSGTQCDPVAFSNTPAFEMDAGGDRRQTHRSIDNSYDCRSRCETPLSLADSFESQDLCPSELHATKRTDPRRIQYRKEIYLAVKHDDGYIWGREYSLASTAISREYDDLEL
ncbi:MAG: hypothetical protein Q9209_001137 [Squamulea sp. 1 TL-2023]